MNTEELTVLLVALTLLLGTARLMGELARSLGQPSVIGEMLAGIVLGPTILGSISPEAYNWLFMSHGDAWIALDGLIQVSAVLLLLIAGLDIDLTTAWRQGKSALLIAMIGMLIPFSSGFGIAMAAPQVFGAAAEPNELLAFAIFSGIALSITALPVIAKILLDLNILKSDLGILIMSAAMLNDLAGWVGFAVVMALITPGGGSHGGVGITLLTTGVFLVSMMTFGRMLIHRTLPFIQAYGSWPGGVIGFVLVITLICAAATEAIGIHAIFGAFIAGVAIGDSRHLRERTRETIHQFIFNIFAPVFFAGIGLRVNFVEAFNPWVVAAAVVIASVGKVLGCYIAGKLSGLGKRESLAVASGMLGQGTMGVILGKLALEAGLINDEFFVAIVCVALITTLVSGPAIQRVLRRESKRTLGQLLSEERFIPKLVSAGAQDAIRELSARASDITQLDEKMLSQAVWKREQVMRTGMGMGLAVPHARLKELTEPLIVIGRSEQGVDFDAPDGLPARFLCLLLTPLDDQAAQIELLRMVAEAFHDPARRAAALAATNYVEFLAAIRIPGQANEKTELTGA